jgi:hypothetical protein
MTPVIKAEDIIVTADGYGSVHRYPVHRQPVRRQDISPTRQFTDRPVHQRDSSPINKFLKK